MYSKQLGTKDAQERNYQGLGTCTCGRHTMQDQTLLTLMPLKLSTASIVLRWSS